MILNSITKRQNAATTRPDAQFLLMVVAKISEQILNSQKETNKEISQSVMPLSQSHFLACMEARIMSKIIYLPKKKKTDH